MSLYAHLFPELKKWKSVEHLFHKRDSETLRSIESPQREALIAMAEKGVIFGVLRIYEGDAKYLSINAGYPPIVSFPELDILTYTINPLENSEKDGLDAKREFNIDFIRAQKSVKLLGLWTDLTSVPDITGLENLKYLILSDNSLQHLNKIGFLPFLEEIDLTRNVFTSLESFSNLDAPKLKKLKLSGNKISNLCEFEPLAHLTNLEELNLNRNEVKTLDLSAELPNLRRLDLSENKIEKIVRIENLPNLKLLYLNHNRLKALERFNMLPSLETIGVHENPIERVADLHNLPYLKEIGEIEGTDLTQTQVDRIFGYLDRSGLDMRDIRYDDDEWVFRILGPPIARSFRVNEYIELVQRRVEYTYGDEMALETMIFVNGQRFDQCNYLLIQITLENAHKAELVDSIDEAEEVLDHSMEIGRRKPLHVEILPETEFWAHCSNLQAWAEHDYDTRLLHRNIAFPLLRKLTEAGDPRARRVFKEEIGKRYACGSKNVREFLRANGYLKHLSADELSALQ